MVYLKDYLLKDAAKLLNINYSTAKTILRIFRIEKRIDKKNADEERELKSLLYTYKNEEELKNNYSANKMLNMNNCLNQSNQYYGNSLTANSIAPTSNMTNYLNKNFELINHNNNGLSNFKILIKESEGAEKEKTLTQSSLNLELSQHSLNHTDSQSNQIDFQTKTNSPPLTVKSMKEINEQMLNFTHHFQKLTRTVDNCFKNIKLNQQMINSLLQTSSKLHLDVMNLSNKNLNEIGYSNTNINMKNMDNKFQYIQSQDNGYYANTNTNTTMNMNNYDNKDSKSYITSNNSNVLLNQYKNQN